MSARISVCWTPVKSVINNCLKLSPCAPTSWITHQLVVINVQFVQGIGLDYRTVAGSLPIGGQKKLIWHMKKLWWNKMG